MLPVHLLRQSNLLQIAVFRKQFLEFILSGLESEVLDQEFAVFCFLLLDLLLKGLQFLHVLDLLPRETEDELVPIHENVVQLLDGLERLFAGFQLDEAESHGLALFVLDYLGVLKRTDLFEDLVNTALLSLEIKVLDVDNLTQFSSLLLFLLNLLNALCDVRLVDHPQGRVLEVDKVVLELVILEVLHDVLRELRILELSDSYGSIGRY